MENKGKAMMIVIIVLLCVLIVSIFGVSFYAFRTFNTNNDNIVDSGSNLVNTKVLNPAEITTYQLSAPIAVNLAVGTDGSQHSMSVEVGIGIDNTDKKESPTFLSLVQSQEVVVRDVIISVFRTKTIDEMRAVDSQEAVKQEILDKLRAEFDSNLIYSVYFGTFYYD